jgi:hypothetical protein
MMERRPAVVVEVDAVLDRRRDEAQHLFALMLQGVAVTADAFADAKIDEEIRHLRTSTD